MGDEMEMEMEREREWRRNAFSSSFNHSPIAKPTW